jgi:MoxR-like ATPase
MVIASNARDEPLRNASFSRSNHVSHAALLARIRGALASVITGRPDAVERLLLGVLSGGHVLLEDVPGVGKTTLARTLAKVFRVQCTRVQFTPDLLPTDILGAQVLDPRDGSFSFHRGPIFTNVLLADEINRASPRTQSALLEAMNEGQVSVDGVTHPLPKPFFVLATQNPIESQGTFPLPEAQLDRFVLRLSVGYPSQDAALAMLMARQRADPLDAVASLADGAALTDLQAQVREVEVRENVARYLLRVVEATRDHADVALGVSPRGALAYFRAVQSRAFLDGRRYATPDDVQELSGPVLAHRLVLTPKARYGGTRDEDLVRAIVKRVEVPL